MKRLLSAIDITDLALIGGVALLWVGLGMLAAPAPYIVVGALAVAYGVLPALLARRRR